jgi:hypothetical protein
VSERGYRNHRDRACQEEVTAEPSLCSRTADVRLGSAADVATYGAASLLDYQERTSLIEYAGVHFGPIPEVEGCVPA